MKEDIEINDIESEKEPEFCFKLVMLGNSGVGKTSLVKYEIKNNFETNKDSTIIFEHSFKNYSILDKIVRLQIWDTCGDEIYYSSLKNFYRSAFCILLVFSLDDINSFYSLNRWIQDIKENKNSDESFLVLIGNKLDNSNDKLITKEMIDKFCKNNEIENYYEVSSKTGENVHKMFKNIVKQLFVKFAMPILDDNSENKNNSSSLKKKIFYFENSDSCCKDCFCYNQ